MIFKVAHLFFSNLQNTPVWCSTTPAVQQNPSLLYEKCLVVGLEGTDSIKLIPESANRSDEGQVGRVREALLSFVSSVHRGAALQTGVSRPEVMNTNVRV